MGIPDIRFHDAKDILEHICGCKVWDDDSVILDFDGGTIPAKKCWRSEREYLDEDHHMGERIIFPQVITRIGLNEAEDASLEVKCLLGGKNAITRTMVNGMIEFDQPIPAFSLSVDQLTFSPEKNYWIEGYDMGDDTWVNRFQAMKFGDHAGWGLKGGIYTRI